MAEARCDTRYCTAGCDTISLYLVSEYQDIGKPILIYLTDRLAIVSKKIILGRGIFDLCSRNSISQKEVKQVY